MKTFLLTIALMLAATLTYGQANKSRSNQNDQKIVIRGGYNGHGYQPGITYDPRTGWARTSDGFNFRPSSGYTNSMPSTPNRPGQYPRVQPRVNYNLGRPYIAPQVPQSNFRPEPRGGWYQGAGNGW